ncbi:IS1 family transposase [Xenorhabdus cabanillasii]|uniref:IS1 family transposase n=1 Tax=Xenorhabdus cabanillasii TaxID=351673 RepID=UPI000C03F231|nr:IS1 family transposase [Xenorhabdus cabanillasii]PHM76756.1 transposase [Xenorhabdus cabanillasii JM26]
MAKVDVYCRYCHTSEQVKGHGKGNGGHLCYACCKVFQLEYTYQACKPGVKEQIIEIVAHVFGERSRKTLDNLLTLLSPFHIRFYCTDDYAVYDSLPEEEHLTGKTFTQRLERNNLTHRTRIKRLNRKTIEYSKSEEMHDKVIGTFIERENYF